MATRSIAASPSRRETRRSARALEVAHRTVEVAHREQAMPAMAQSKAQVSIFGGWITGYLTKRGWTVTRARKTGMFAFALLVLPILMVTRVGDWTAVTGVLEGTFTKPMPTA